MPRTKPNRRLTCSSGIIDHAFAHARLSERARDVCLLRKVLPLFRPFFAGLVEYMCSGPVVAMVWEGKGVVATGRKIIGALPKSKCGPPVCFASSSSTGRWQRQHLVRLSQGRVPPAPL